MGTGALAGASTLLTLTGVGASVAPTLVGGITGAGNNLISQGFVGGNGNTWNSSNINWGQVGISGVSGAITGYVGGKLADKFTPYVSKYISNMFMVLCCKTWLLIVWSAELPDLLLVQDEQR